MMEKLIRNLILVGIFLLGFLTFFGVLPTQRARSAERANVVVVSTETGSQYILSISGSSWSSTDLDGPVVAEAFKAEVEKLAKNGWVLNPQSIRIALDKYEAWLVAVFEKRA